jgi:hypothetical protein
MGQTAFPDSLLAFNIWLDVLRIGAIAVIIPFLIKIFENGAYYKYYRNLWFFLAFI